MKTPTPLSHMTGCTLEKSEYATYHPLMSLLFNILTKKSILFTTENNDSPRVFNYFLKSSYLKACFSTGPQNLN